MDCRVVSFNLRLFPGSPGDWARAPAIPSEWLWHWPHAPRYAYWPLCPDSTAELPPREVERLAPLLARADVCFLQGLLLREIPLVLSLAEPLGLSFDVAPSGWGDYNATLVSRAMFPQKTDGPGPAPTSGGIACSRYKTSAGREVILVNGASVENQLRFLVYWPNELERKSIIAALHSPAGRDDVLLRFPHFCVPSRALATVASDSPRFFGECDFIITDGLAFSLLNPSFATIDGEIPWLPHSCPEFPWLSLGCHFPVNALVKI